MNSLTLVSQAVTSRSEQDLIIYIFQKYLFIAKNESFGDTWSEDDKIVEHQRRIPDYSFKNP